MITAVVLTKNEEKNIERCMKSLLWSDEIVIIDDYSEDDTIEKVKSQKSKVKSQIKIFKRILNGDFAGQRNYGLSKAKGEWVLFVDADEQISEELKNETLSKCHPEFISGSNKEWIPGQARDDIKLSGQDNIKGYLIKRKDYFLGKWLKYGETANVSLLRLAKKNSGNWEGRVHETWRIKGKIGQLQSPIYHYPHSTIDSFLAKINNYTDLVAQYWQEEGRSIGGLEIIFYPAGKFIQNYVLRFGFLDGIPGLIMAVMMSFHSFLARGKLWLKQHP